MNAYLINLQTRPDRLTKALAQCEQAGIKPTVFEATNGRTLPLPTGWRDGPGAYGCSLSHRGVLRHCIEQKHEVALILEDDVTFVDGYGPKFWNMMFHVPDNWDAIMLGGQHIKEPQHVNEHVVRAVRVARTHAYLIRLSYMPTLLNIWNTEMGHVDHTWRNHMTDAGVNVYCPVKWLAGQAAGHSDINGRDLPERYWHAERPKLVVRGGQRIMVRRAGQ
jgi:GR25 family glycosyltransferase involved in LPS biosynthesis